MVNIPLALSTSYPGYVTLSATTVTLAQIDSVYNDCTIYIETETAATATYQIEGSQDGQQWFPLMDAADVDPNGQAVRSNKDFIPHVRVTASQASGAAADASMRCKIHWERKSTLPK